MSSSPLSVASSVPSSPSFPECGWGDLPELLRFGDQPPSPPWDSDAEKCLSELASPQPPLPTLPPSPPSPATSPTPVSPPPRPHVTSTPYLVALESVGEALTCTAVPPPSPPQPPKYVPKDPPTPPKPNVHGPYSAKTLQLIRENHGGGVQYFVDGVLNRRAIGLRFSSPRKTPCGCGRRACELAVRISFRGTRSMQQWCLKSCPIPQNPPVSPSRPHNLCLVGHYPSSKLSGDTDPV